MLGTLLEHGANIHQRTNDDGGTVLHAACNGGLEEIEIIKLLLFAGADVLIEDRDGKTPLALINRYHMEKPEEPRILLFIKALALKKACQPSVVLKDESIIKEYPRLWNYYHGCAEELDRMKMTRFIETCSFFDLLSKSHCRISKLMRNPEFETKFFISDYQSIFSTYAEELLRAFERAEYHHHSTLQQEDIIKEAVYDNLPYVVVRKVARYIINDSNDCCKNVK